MRKALIFVVHFLLVSFGAFSQNIGIGTTRPDSSAALDITSTNQGILIPRMNLISILAIPFPAKGLMAFDSVANQLMANIGSGSSPNWQPVTGNAGAQWSLIGNRGTNPQTNFLGTTDNQPLRFRINNTPAGELNPLTGNVFWGLLAGRQGGTGFSNIGIGAGVLQSDSTSSNLVAIGDSALHANISGTGNTAVGSKTLLANTIGSFNVANGQEALANNISGGSNVAIGFRSLFNNTIATSNVAVGTNAMLRNTTGANNTATGTNSLLSNTTGNSNVANGVSALFSNTTGSDNIAIGVDALVSNGVGSTNIAVGSSALSLNNNGNNNVAIGQQAMASNTGGGGNVAIGNGSLFSSQFGSGDVALGINALSNTSSSTSNDNTAVGFATGSHFALGESNTLIGAFADGWGDGANFCVALGAGSRCTQDNQVMLGNSATTNISGFANFSKLSDGRFKKNIREDVQGLAFILKLRPITYQVDIASLNAKMAISTGKRGIPAKYISEGERVVHSGFIAQEVEQAAKDLGYDFSGVDRPQHEGGLYALRYAEFVVPLVKAVQEQENLIDSLKKKVDELTNHIAALEKKNSDEQIHHQGPTGRIPPAGSAGRGKNPTLQQ